MGLIQAILELLFGKKPQPIMAVSAEEAAELVEKEIGGLDARLSEFAPKKFAEIRHLISGLSRNAQLLADHDIKTDEGSRQYRQIVATSQKNLSRQLSGISGKLTPPQDTGAKAVRSYASDALKTVTTDLMPYWKNIAIARLMLRDEVKKTGASLQELHAVLQELNSAAFPEKLEPLTRVKAIFAELVKREQELSEFEAKKAEQEKAISGKQAGLSALKSRLAELRLSPDAVVLDSLLKERASLESRKAGVVSRFNSEIAPLEKALKRLEQASASSLALTAKEKETLHLLLTSPAAAFVSDPNGAVSKGLLLKAEKFISEGAIRMKEGDAIKRLDAIRAFLSKDFFSEYFWETNKIQAELQSVQKSISSLTISQDTASLSSEIAAEESALSRLNAALIQLSAEGLSMRLRSLRAALKEGFDSAFAGRFTLKS